MKIYKKNNQYIIKFESIPLVHILIIDNYIEYIKQNYPDFLLEKYFCKIEWNDLDKLNQNKLKDYFQKSLSKANKKVKIFTEALNSIS